MGKRCISIVNLLKSILFSFFIVCVWLFPNCWAWAWMTVTILLKITDLLFRKRLNQIKKLHPRFPIFLYDIHSTHGRAYKRRLFVKVRATHRSLSLFSQNSEYQISIILLELIIEVRQCLGPRWLVIQARGHGRWWRSLPIRSPPSVSPSLSAFLSSALPGIL